MSPQGTHDIIVIGASAGGLEALKVLAAGLPPDLPASLFVVWHMSPEARGVVPQALARVTSLPAANARDGELIEPGRVYVAPPDRHLLVERGRVRVTRGPKENRFRPAVDPLFRSAAYAFGARVIGVVLSGGLDDGTAGLWTIKNRGGLAVVQDPADAEVASMPESAMRGVAVDHVVPAAGMAELLDRLCREPVAAAEVPSTADDERTAFEVRIAADDRDRDANVFDFGSLTPYACPDCHGVLAALRDGEIVRFRCHTGHAFSADGLLATISETIEESLYSALRGLDESVMLLNHVGDHFAERNDTALAAVYFRKAKEAEARASLVRAAVAEHEHLSQDRLGHGLTALAGEAS